MSMVALSYSVVVVVQEQVCGQKAFKKINSLFSQSELFFRLRWTKHMMEGTTVQHPPFNVWTIPTPTGI